jgi:hypothetical protein
MRQAIESTASLPHLGCCTAEAGGRTVVRGATSGRMCTGTLEARCYHRFLSAPAIFQGWSDDSGGELVSTGVARQRGACRGA